MSQGVVLNIGWARAGSTALRQNFLRRHPEIVVAGRAQPPHAGPASQILEALKAADEGEFRRRLPLLKEKWAGYVSRNPGWVCLSDEELSIGLPGGLRPTDLASRCALLFPEARILAVVRDQIEAIGSFYALSQRPVFGRRMAFPDWLDRHFLKPDRGDGFDYLYAYGETLRAYARTRRRGDILVLEHGSVRANPCAAYRAIARWLGISDACSAFPTATLNASPGRRPAWSNDRAIATRALYAPDNRVLAEEFEIDFHASHGAKS